MSIVEANFRGVRQRVPRRWGVVRHNGWLVLAAALAFAGCGEDEPADQVDATDTTPDAGGDVDDDTVQPLDCAGTPGGLATEDFCGVCDDDASNDNTTCTNDCAGTIDGGATLDDCGVCDDDVSNDNTTCVQDCEGTWGGGATLDDCGVCDSDASNDNTTCAADCAGVLGGSSETDDCGVCDEDASNDNTTCVPDCAGIWGGTATRDTCGVCDDDVSNDNTTCEEDCAGTPDGQATEDSCGVCDANPSNDNETCVPDCAGTWGGTATTDDCGVCDDTASNDNTTCAQDCQGNWGGGAATDDCGVCDTSVSNDNTTCEQDCAGVWGGTSVEDACGVCDANPSNDDACVTDYGPPGYDSYISPLHTLPHGGEASFSFGTCNICPEIPGCGLPEVHDRVALLAWDHADFVNRLDVERVVIRLTTDAFSSNVYNNQTDLETRVGLTAEPIWSEGDVLWSSSGLSIFGGSLTVQPVVDPMPSTGDVFDVDVTAQYKLFLVNSSTRGTTFSVNLSSDHCYFGISSIDSSDETNHPRLIITER